MRLENTAAWLWSRWFRLTGPIKRRLAVAAVILFLIAFGDSVLPWLGHGAHLLIETVESALEHVLETAFGLSPRGAQAVIAWTALAVAIYLTVRLIRRLHRACALVSAKWPRSWVDMKSLVVRSGRSPLWLTSVTLLFVFGFTLYLFS